MIQSDLAKDSVQTASVLPVNGAVENALTSMGVASEWMPLMKIVGTIVVLLVLIAVGVTVIKMLFPKNKQYGPNSKLDKTTVVFLRKVCIYTIYVVGGIMILRTIPGLQTLGTSLLAGAGVFAMAIGFASQEALSNFISGVFIVVAKPYRIGDFIQVNGHVGHVDDISLRHTIINQLDNRKIIIPNSKMNSADIVNSSIGPTETCSAVEVGVSYDTDLKVAMTIMREECMKHPKLVDMRTEADKAAGVPQVVIRVIELGNSAITLRAWCWTASYGDAFVIKCDLLESIKNRFDQEKIEIPFPCTNIYQRK